MDKILETDFEKQVEKAFIMGYMMALRVAYIIINREKDSRLVLESIQEHHDEQAIEYSKPTIFEIPGMKEFAPKITPTHEPDPPIIKKLKNNLSRSIKQAKLYDPKNENQQNNNRVRNRKEGRRSSTKTRKENR